MRDGALVLLPAPAPAGQRDEEERRPEHEERGREESQHPDPGHALPPRPPQQPRGQLILHTDREKLYPQSLRMMRVLVSNLT